MKIVHKQAGDNLNCSPKCSEGFFLPILNRLKMILEYQQYKQYKTFVARLDLYFPKTIKTTSNNNYVIRKFLEELSKAVTREGRKENPKTKTNIKYLWKAEKKMNDVNQHFHLLFTCNAEAFHSLKKLLNLSTFYWNKQFNLPNHNFSLVNQSGKGGINGKVLLRTESYTPLFTWVSYLAKVKDTSGVSKVFDSSQSIGGHSC